MVLFYDKIIEWLDEYGCSLDSFEHNNLPEGITKGGKIGLKTINYCKFRKLFKKHITGMDADKSEKRYVNQEKLLKLYVCWAISFNYLPGLFIFNFNDNLIKSKIIFNDDNEDNLNELQKLYDTLLDHAKNKKDEIIFNIIKAVSSSRNYFSLRKKNFIFILWLFYGYSTIIQGYTSDWKQLEIAITDAGTETKTISDKLAEIGT